MIAQNLRQCWKSTKNRPIRIAVLSTNWYKIFKLYFCDFLGTIFKSFHDLRAKEVYIGLKEGKSDWNQLGKD